MTTEETSVINDFSAILERLIYQVAGGGKEYDDIDRTSEEYKSLLPHLEHERLFPTYSKMRRDFVTTVLLSVALERQETPGKMLEETRGYRVMLKTEEMRHFVCHAAGMVIMWKKQLLPQERIQRIEILRDPKLLAMCGEVTAFATERLVACTEKIFSVDDANDLDIAIEDYNDHLSQFGCFSHSDVLLKVVLQSMVKEQLNKSGPSIREVQWDRAIKVEMESRCCCNCLTEALTMGASDAQNDPLLRQLCCDMETFITTQFLALTKDLLLRYRTATQDHRALFAAGSKKYKALYRLCSDESRGAVCQMALRSILDERRQRQRPDTPLEETQGYRVLQIEMDIIQHLDKVLADAPSGDIPFLQVCFQVVLRQEEEEVDVDIWEQASLERITKALCCLMKQYVDNDAFLSLAIEFGEKLLKIEDEPLLNTRHAADAPVQKYIIPACLDIMGNIRTKPWTRESMFELINGVYKADSCVCRVLRESGEEDTITGSCRYLDMLVTKKRLIGKLTGSWRCYEHPCYDVQRSLFSALRDYPYNKVLVGCALRNLLTNEGSNIYPSDEEDIVGYVVKAMRSVSTNTAFYEGSRVLHFYLRVGREATMRAFLRAGGVSTIVLAMKFTPYSRALEILALCYHRCKSSNDNFVGEMMMHLANHDAVQSVVTSLIECLSDEEDQLLNLVAFLVSKQCKGSDGGLILHYLASIQQPYLQSESVCMDLESQLLYIGLARMVYPGAVFVRDRNDRLPLHVAIQAKSSEEIVQSLVEGREELCSAAFEGCLPFELAARRDCDVGVINLLLRKDPSGIEHAMYNARTGRKRKAELVASVPC